MINRFRTYLKKEAQAIDAIPLDGEAEKAAQTILGCQGKVFTTGIGKAGYIAKKAASTFSTTGTPAAYIHPADASHGDVGAVAKGDILLAFSNSGRTREVIETVKFCRALGISSVITFCSSKDSPLGMDSDITLQLGQIAEACPYGLTPSASTAAMIALADALALVVMEDRGFSRQDWALRHHGGYLGEKSRKQEN